MLQLKTLVIVFGFLAVVSGHKAPAKDPPTTPCTTTTTCKPGVPGSDNSDRFDNETLCSNFQFMRSTIDKNHLVDIIQTHNKCNPKFRKAMQFYNTPRFHQTMQQLQHSQAYHNIITALREEGVDTSSIENILDIFACLEISNVPPNSDCDCKAVRGHTFVGDILHAMPHKTVHEYTEAAKALRNNFARFVKTLNSPEFRARVNANLRRGDVARALRSLQQHGWDMSELLHAAMTVASW